jgi:hypothetical protein
MEFHLILYHAKYPHYTVDGPILHQLVTIRNYETR